MRKLLMLGLFAVLLLVFMGVALGAAIHWAGSLDGMRVTVDGETMEGPAVAALVGGAAFIGVLVACLVAFAVVASVAIVIPIVLIVVALALLFAVCVGLAPIAIPVLLVLGAYALLSRRSRRRALETGGPLQSSTSPS